MIEEKWFVIQKFPTYEINNCLEVRHRVFKKVKKCFLSDGYLRLNLEKDGHKYKPYLHQIVAWTFVSNPENKPEIHHKDCNQLNNHWDNLQWVTRSEHRRISKENGQLPHKLKPSDVIEIREKYNLEKESELAVRFNVSTKTIYNIAIGATRNDIGGKFHDPKGVTKKIINIETNEIFGSAEELSMITGIKIKTIRRQLSGERYNYTPFRYLGEEHLSIFKPIKRKVIPFVPHSFGIVIPRKELLRSKNPKALWKKVVQYDLSGNEIATHESIRKAAAYVGSKDHKLLQKLLNGRRGKTYKGFIWKYAD